MYVRHSTLAWVFLVFGIAAAIAALYGIVTGEVWTTIKAGDPGVGIDGNSNRDENPITYWVFVSIWSFIAVGFLAASRELFSKKS